MGRDVFWQDATPVGEGPSLDAGATEVLAERLRQINDRRLMKGLVSTALAHMLREPVDVVEHEVQYCKVKPWPDINLALQVTLRCATGGLRRCHLSCTIRPKTSNALEQFEDEVSRRSDRSIAVVPEMAMIVRLFPCDLVLTGLGAATNESGMIALLRAHLPPREDDCRPGALRYEVVHYKPERLCTLRYTVQLIHPTNRLTGVTDVYGKVYCDDRWKSSHEFQSAMWRAASASDNVWRTARPVVCVPEARFVLQEAVEGRPFRRVFDELTQDDASEAELTQAVRLLTAVARTVRLMQRAPVLLGPRLDFATLWGNQARNLPYLDHSYPRLGRELARLRTALARFEGRVGSLPLGPAHGDFAYANVLVDNGVVGVIDFDKGGQAEPAYDPAYFLTHLSSFGIRHPKRLRHVTRLCEVFRHAYLGFAPEVPPHRLALYEALDLVAYVLRNFKKQSHQPNWVPWADAQIACAWERLTWATRQRRCAS